jgi:hypothetical protein
MGHVDEEIRFKRKRGIDIILIPLSCMKRDPFTGLPCRTDLQFHPGHVTGAADPQTICIDFTAFPAEDDWQEIKACRCLLERMDPGPAALPEISAPKCPGANHAGDGRPHRGNQFCMRCGSKDPMLKTVRGCNHANQIPGTPAIHSNSICKVGVGVKERRTDPERRGPGILLDRSDQTLLDHDIDRPERELLTKQCLTGYDLRGVHRMS